MTGGVRVLGAAALLFVAAAPARGAEPAARTVDPLGLRCKEFLALAPAERARVALWLDGFIKATRNRPEEVGDTAIGHPLDPVVAACEREPDLSFADTWVKRYPGGLSATPPFKVTCRELARRDASVRAAVASFLEGYAAEQASRQGAQPAVSLASPRPRLDAACAKTPRAKAADAFRASR